MPQDDNRGFRYRGVKARDDCGQGKTGAGHGKELKSYPVQNLKSPGDTPKIEHIFLQENAVSYII